MIHFANVGHNIFIGNREACHERPRWFGKVLHIGLISNPEHQCKHFQPGAKYSGYGDMSIDYLDGTSLAGVFAARMPELQQLFRDNDPVFIHCFAGTYRSPTLAVLGKGLRGGDPFNAMSEIARATRSRYGLFPHFHDVPIREICEVLGY